MSGADAEALLKKVRKMEANKICPNCGTTAPTGLGFGSICIKFKTFVCDSCKSSHAAYSHRCKSVQMSTWTMDEVRSLTSEYNGGNLAALHNWLYSAPPPGGRYSGGARPQKGDRIDIYKQFVVDCYEKGMFKAITPFEPPRGNSTPKSAGHSNPAPAPAPVRRPAPPAQPSPPTVNFFDNDFEEEPSASQRQRVSILVSSSQQDPFFGASDPFSGTSDSPMHSPVAAARSTISTSGFDFFDTASPSLLSASSSGFNAPPAPPPQSSCGFDFMNGGNQVSNGVDFFASAPPQTRPLGAGNQTKSEVDFFASAPPQARSVSAGNQTKSEVDFFASAPQNQSNDFFGQSTSNGEASHTLPAAPLSSSAQVLDLFGSDFLSPSVGAAPMQPISTAPVGQGPRIGAPTMNGGGMAISSMMGPSGGTVAATRVNATTSTRGPADNFDFVKDSLGQSRGRGVGQGMSYPVAQQNGSMPGGGMMSQPMMNRGATYPMNGAPHGGQSMGWGAPQQQQWNR